MYTFKEMESKHLKNTDVLYFEAWNIYDFGSGNLELLNMKLLLVSCGKGEPLIEKNHEEWTILQVKSESLFTNERSVIFK